jgi:signal transduction histidine kinase
MERNDHALDASAPRALLIGRIAGAFYAGSGLLTLITTALPGPTDVNRVATVTISLIAVAIGVFAWRAPWDRWPDGRSLWLVPVALALIAGGNVFGGSAPPYTYGIFFVLVFVWIGIGHRQWTSVKVAPLATIAYVLPILRAPGNVVVNATTVTVTIPVCVLVGESLAWLNGKLRTTERALRESERRFAAAYEAEHRLAGQLREVDQMKDGFLQAVSHELRTPLAVVLGTALTLRRSARVLSEEERMEMTDALVSKARKLDGLVLDLLDVDRLARGVLRPSRKPTDVAALIRAVVDDLSLDERHAVTLDLVPLVTSLDAPKVERIVEHLLANVDKHTPTGTPVVVRARPADGGALITVEDAGPGIPADLRRSVFEPFSHGATRQEHAPGMAVGLSLVARFAQLHGGDAWIEAREGGGSVFHVLLPGDDPRGEPEPEPELEPASREPAQPLAGPARRTMMGR